MSVKYRVIRIRNPFRKAEEGKFYPVPVSKGKATLEEVATTVSQKTALSTTDVIATIDALLHAIPEYLSAGYILDFGSFGTFRIFFESTGSETKEKVNAGNIKSVKLNFRPGKRLKENLEKTKFTREK
jgi:predicted histone-like DNA-binding protein